MTNQVTATLHDIGGAGELIDAAGEAAGDAVRVQQLGFSIDDDSAARAQARADAVRQAQAQAKQMAEAAGVRLGRIHSIIEVPVNPLSPFYRDSVPAESATVPIPAGVEPSLICGRRLGRSARRRGEHDPRGVRRPVRRAGRPGRVRGLLLPLVALLPALLTLAVLAVVFCR